MGKDRHTRNAVVAPAAPARLAAPTAVAAPPWRVAGRTVPSAALGLPTVVLTAVLMAVLAAALPAPSAQAQVQTPVPPEERGRIDAERYGFHDAANIRTVFWNYGMVGDYPDPPLNVDLSVFHSVEVPKGSGMNYSDGITPFVLAKIRQRDGSDAYIMETGFRERQGTSPYSGRIMRFEPRRGYFQADPSINRGRSPAISNDPRTWPDCWPDKPNVPDDCGWSGQWNGYFGKRAAADQESFMVMDDQFYDAWDYYPDSRDATRRGLGLRIEVRGFQWANPQAGNVIFWHYDITNESTTDYNDNIIFGLYMDSGVGGSAESCDHVAESDDDNAFFDRTLNAQVLNLVYTWDKKGHGRDLSGCGRTGYLGYAYLETPGNSTDGVDNDEDGITDEQRDGGEGELIVDRDQIRAYVTLHYDLTKFQAAYGPLEDRPGYRAGRWWTGDEDMDWNQNLNDVGADGVPDTHDTGEGDGRPTLGEPNFDRTDLNESDQIGLTGFKLNRIKSANPDPTVDNILFFTDASNWPQRLYEQFTNPNPAARFDPPLADNYNIAFLFASGPFNLRAGKTERFSLALAYGGDINELRRTVKTVQQIYNANYQFAVPPPQPTAKAESGDGFVRLSWDAKAEQGADPVTGEFDFEGYRIYRSTDPEFRDPRVITTSTGSGPLGNGKPIAQFDLNDGRNGFSDLVVEGVAYYLGNDSGIRHTWTDSTVTNGQQYFYAVCAYDFGSDLYGFYPSENAITVSHTARAGLILPSNVVTVRPEPKAPGFIAATADAATHVAGEGTGTVGIQVVASNHVPDGHLFHITFANPSPDSIRAVSYSLIDVTRADSAITIFKGATDLDGEGIGPTGAGLLPVVRTQEFVAVRRSHRWSRPATDPTATGFAPGGPTNAKLKVAYSYVLPINLRRSGYPDDITIIFDDTVRDTSLTFPITLEAPPAKFLIIAHEPGGDRQLDFRFRDSDHDGTLSGVDEYVDIVTYTAAAPTTGRSTWRAQLDTLGQGGRGPLQPPRAGDVFQLKLTTPFTTADLFAFNSRGERVDAAQAMAQARPQPYVVPNPYVGSASFEPERFAVSGRGERRIEFRDVPTGCTINIYTVRGELVQTLRQDGSNDAFIAWNLRTKDNLDVAPGLYIFNVDGGSLGSSTGKFSIIK